MAWDFSKSGSTPQDIDLGNGAIVSLLDGSSAYSWGCWFYGDTYTDSQTSRNVILTWHTDGAVAGDNILAWTNIQTDSSPDNRIRCVLSPADGEPFSTVVPSSTSCNTGSWHNFICAADVANDSVALFINGVADGTGSPTWTSTTVSDGSPTLNDALSYNANNSDLEWDGKIAEVAVWNTNLVLADAQQFHKGFSPLLIKPENLVFYLPLYGDSLVDEISAVSGTAQGSTVKFADHPTILRPSARIIPFRTATAAGAAGGTHPQFGLMGVGA